MGIAKVRCMVCGAEMSYLNNRHLASHGMTPTEYRERFPDAPMKSETVTAKMRANGIAINSSRKGKPRSREEIAAIREGIARSAKRQAHNRGVPMSEETKRKLSEAHRKAFAEGRRKSHRLGVKLSPETREKISKALKGRKIGSAAALKAIETKRAKGYDLAPMRGKKLSEESRKKIGEASRRIAASKRPILREHMLQKIEASGLKLLNSITEDRFHLVCLKCNHEFHRTAAMFQNSKWHPEICDQCYPVSNISLTETEIGDLISGWLPETRLVRSDMEVISPLELDIYIPEKALAVEYCGLWWHSELAGKKRWYHRYKMEACKNKGIRLLTIFEDEWLTKRPIVESILRNALDLTTHRIGARKCSIEILDPNDASNFLEANHVQGRGRSKVKYGLVYNGEIVAAMTFMDSEVSRRSKGWEINRFCVKAGMSVPGAASRLFRRFIEDHGPEKVVSYADLRWGTGNVYEQLGFKLEGLTTPNYWYFKAGEHRRWHRYGLRKTPEDDPNRTEWEIRQEQGWNRIWDCGHAKWVWEPV